MINFRTKLVQHSLVGISVDEFGRGYASYQPSLSGFPKLRHFFRFGSVGELVEEVSMRNWQGLLFGSTVPWTKSHFEEVYVDPGECVRSKIESGLEQKFGSMLCRMRYDYMDIGSTDHRRRFLVVVIPQEEEVYFRQLSQKIGLRLFHLDIDCLSILRAIQRVKISTLRNIECNVVAAGADIAMERGKFRQISTYCYPDSRSILAGDWENEELDRRYYSWSSKLYCKSTDTKIGIPNTQTELDLQAASLGVSIRRVEQIMSARRDADRKMHVVSKVKKKKKIHV